MGQSTIIPTGAIPNPVEKGGLCLLSLDGGGVRGLSTLYILKRIMDEVNRLREEKGLPSRKPYEVFDMIGGTSTGGLIAIMLGRLHMSVEECIDVYKKLMESIFGSMAHWSPVTLSLMGQARYDSRKVKEAILEVLRDRGLPENSPLNDNTDHRCKVFVCCVANDTKAACRIRSYNQKLQNNDSATISEAALATSAATSYFEPATINQRQYLDGALRNNNPVTEVEDEAQRLWCSDQVELKPLVKCFLSLGTGTPAKEAFKFSALGLINSLTSLATETEATNAKFQKRWLGQLRENRLFRFDVAHGLQNINLADYKKQGTIIQVTDEYMEEGEQQIKLQACTANLMEKELQGTPLDFHKTVSAYTLRVQQGGYETKDIRDCHAVLCVTDVEKDRDHLSNINNARVPGTLEWITSNTSYLDWRDSGRDALWITAGPGRGKTMLSLFILEYLEQYISRAVMSPGKVVQEKSHKKADLYYFFCSNEEGSRRSAITVFRSLIYQIVTRHDDLMKHVLDYLVNDRPVHKDVILDEENEERSRNQERKGQRSRSVDIQNTMERKFPAQANFVKNHLSSLAGVKGATEDKVGPSTDAQAEVKSGSLSKSKPTIFQSMFAKSRREETPKDRAEKQQSIQSEADQGDTVDPPERDSPKSRQLELLDVSELSYILKKLILKLDVDMAYFLVNGVDKCVKEDQQILASTMLKLCDVAPGKFKLLIVSQPNFTMSTTPTIRLEETEQTKSDVEKFISKSLEQCASVDRFGEIRSDVEQKLSSRAEGTFLWVSLVLRDIAEKQTCVEILAAIDSFQPGLNNKYKNMLQQINPAHQQIVYAILRWVIAAHRPLTLHELSEVIETLPSSSMSPEQAVRDGVDLSKGLLKLEGPKVKLIHSSAKSFFFSDKFNDDGSYDRVSAALEEEKLNYDIAQSCYDYIAGSSLRRSEMQVSDLSDKEEPKMLKYAVQYWMNHVKASRTWAEKNFDSNAEFFRWDSKLRKNWWVVYLEISQKDEPRNFNVASFLHMAAYFGIPTWIKQASDGKAWIVRKGTTLMELDHYYRTPLHIAVEQGHDSVVSLLLQQGVNIEFREASLFATPLHLAARNGHKSICEILLDNRASVNARNRFDSTPLTEAARGGHLEVVKLLVQRSADINGSIDKKRKSLYRQIENIPGHTERAFGRITSIVYAERSTPVIEAARRNHADIIRYLIRHGASIEATTLEGFTAVQIAAYNGQLKSMEILVELGANIEKKDDYGRTALFMASLNNQADVVKWLLDHDADRDPVTNRHLTPLIIASKNGFVEPMRILLEAKAAIEHRDDKGFTSLAVAAESGKVAAVKLLVNYDAKIDAQDQRGNSPIMHAIQEELSDEHVETVQLLLKHGANVNHKNQRSLTPLMKAAELSDGDAATIVQRLLDKGAALGERDDQGRTVLMHAFIEQGSSKTQELLVDSGTVLEAKDDLGDTALIIAAGYSHPSGVQLLLDRGADIEARDRFGFTPLIKAAKCGWEHIVTLLLDRGAEIAATDNEGKSAIDHAAARERGNIIKLLKSRGASRHNLNIINYAAEQLSNVMYWRTEACREWERDWEAAALKKIGRSRIDEGGDDDTDTKEPNKHGAIYGSVKASDVDLQIADEKMVDEGSAQTNAEEQMSQDVQDSQRYDSAYVGAARPDTDSIQGSTHSDGDGEQEEKVPDFEAVNGQLGGLSDQG